MLNFQDLVDTEQLEPEMTKSGPICMNQWKQMFGVTRVPQEGCDKNVGNHPAFARHIIVLIGDQAFAVQVLDPSGDRVQVSEIQKQLHDTVSLFKSSKKQPEICLLTSGHRDKWCKTYKHLRELSPINNSNFDLIESSLFVISLDDYSVGPTLNDHTRKFLLIKATYFTEKAVIIVGSTKP